MSATLALVALAVGVTACYPGRPSTVTERDSVTTFFDGDANFGALERYGLADRILVREDSNDIDLDPADEAAILNAVRNNMAARGYTETADTQGMQAVLLVSVSQRTIRGWVSGGCSPGWGGWPGWGWPGYGCWYPWAVPYEYDVGTVFIDMFDPTPENPDVPPGQQLAAVWAAGLDGILTSTNDVNLGRVLGGVDQAFTQSPYLQRAP